MTNTLALQDWLKVIEQEYLQGFVKDGGASVKFAVPEGFNLLPLVRESLAVTASNLNYVVVNVDASDTRVHMPQDIFFKIASQIDWRALARQMILNLSADVGYSTSMVDANVESPVVKTISEVNAIDERLIRIELRRRLAEAVTLNVNMSRDFRSAMTSLCLIETDRTGESQEGSALIEWLTGQTSRISNVRTYSIYNRVNRTNARHFLESLLYWVRFVGSSGTVVLLDNSRILLRQNPRDGLRFYSRSAVMDHYELLRELLDATDRLEALFMVVLSNSDFLDDDPARRGFSIYRALMGRIADEVRDRNQANPMSALVRLVDSVQKE